VFAAWFRFDVQSTVVAQTVSSASLMFVPGSISTLSTNVYSFASAIKLRKVIAWPPAGGEVNLQWNGAAGNVRDSAMDVTLPTGVTVTKPTSFVPPPESFSALWWEGGQTSKTLMQISATSGSVIDVLLDYTLSNVLANAVGVVASSVVGSVYYGYLDGASTHIFKPLGRQSTF
jgi:hypothetical protein